MDSHHLTLVSCLAMSKVFIAQGLPVVGTGMAGVETSQGSVDGVTLSVTLLSIFPRDILASGLVLVFVYI